MVCLIIEDVPVVNEETAEESFRKTENRLKKFFANLLILKINFFNGINYLEKLLEDRMS